MGSARHQPADLLEVAVAMEESPARMKQTAPYPHDLAGLVADTSYREGWLVYLTDEDRGQGCSGLTVVILVDTVNSYPPHDPMRVRHLFPVPPAAYNRASWQRWLFECFLLVERHEAMEFFTVAGAKPYAPNHGPGHDPYTIRELTTDVDRRTSWRGEVQPVLTDTVAHYDAHPPTLAERMLPRGIGPRLRDGR